MFKCRGTSLFPLDQRINKSGVVSVVTSMSHVHVVSRRAREPGRARGSPGRGLHVRAEGIKMSIVAFDDAEDHVRCCQDGRT